MALGPLPLGLVATFRKRRNAHPSPGRRTESPFAAFELRAGRVVGLVLSRRGFEVKAERTR